MPHFPSSSGMSGEKRMQVGGKVIPLYPLAKSSAETWLTKHPY